MDAAALAVAAAAVDAAQDAPGSARVPALEDAVMPANRRALTARRPAVVPVIRDAPVDAVTLVVTVHQLALVTAPVVVTVVRVVRVVEEVVATIAMVVALIVVRAVVITPAVLAVRHVLAVRAAQAVRVVVPGVRVIVPVDVMVAADVGMGVPVPAMELAMDARGAADALLPVHLVQGRVPGARRVPGSARQTAPEDAVPNAVAVPGVLLGAVLGVKTAAVPSAPVTVMGAVRDSCSARRRCKLVA